MMLLGNEHGMIIVDSSNTIQLDGCTEGIHCCIYIIVGYSYSHTTVLFCYHGNTR